MIDAFKGKSPSERNKMIAAAVLGVLALSALAYAFLPGLFRSSTTVSVKTSTPTPSPSGSPSSGQFKLPSQDEQNWDYATIPVNYVPASYGAPAPRRNIFAFYEPPPWTPTPIPPVIVPTPKPPTPTPSPDYLIAFVMPQSVYAGSRGFRLEINGDLFTPEAKIYFNQMQLPTNFVSAQKLTADVPATLISSPGSRQVIVQSLDGTKYSQMVAFNIQAPPKPQLLYIGMVSRKYGNNDTAYFIEQSRLNTPGAAPQSRRLNDIIEGRFKLVSIATKQVIVEDVNLGFRHPISIYTPTPGTSGPGAPGGFPGGFPAAGFPQVVQPGSIPGFPGMTMPQARPPANNAPRREDRNTKADADEDDDPK